MAKPYRTLREQMAPDAQAQAAQQAAAMLRTIPDATPGQICYEAYWRSARYGRVPVAWAKLLPHWRAGWDAAAQAVLETSLGFRFAIGQHVTWDEAPGAVWQIIERRQHEGTERTWRTYDLLPAAGDLTDFRPLSAVETHLDAAEEDQP
jgi:hypothetical protein